ncbi:WbqC family protein [Kordia sp. YSTF-M3]|uniref:WbqC family protein n=1 Tax=Kordia aestuariivivens TaxID=2759037 RepID=A0ABR7Q995_9FLAO|nr:WbqC family protein [Kordia aestuariivivens]MBC8755142.1 WbqC family protein [Kordia aestuariivivens]
MKPKKVAIIQSNYIPWKGYFDMINNSDVFVVYDEMQYTKNDWRNRNIIKTQNGTQWLTIPIQMSGKFGQKINETEVSNQIWRKKHWKTIVQNYNKTPYFNTYKEVFEQLYLDVSATNLSEINISFIKTINKILNIETEIIQSKDLQFKGSRNERLIEICQQLNATTYISGPKAKNYMDTELFETHNIKIEWVDYSGYPEYHQKYLPFEHGVTILDLIFNEGPNAHKFMKSF